jgi:hypothetical protein
MFGWFKKKKPSLQPEERWLVAVDGDRISVRDDAGQTASVIKEELSGVAIETNDSGPWGADVWWLLFDGDGQLACAYPQGATGEETALKYLSALPSFDHGEMIRAMTSTDNEAFVVWQR